MSLRLFGTGATHRGGVNLHGECSQCVCIHWILTAGLARDSAKGH